MSTHTFLSTILERRREAVARQKAQCPEANLREQIEQMPPPRSLRAAIHRQAPPAIIAEIKKASPSAGLIREDFSPVDLAREYAAHGAAALSVLTEEEWFQGSPEFIREIRPRVAIPILRKDFILDPYQVLEARALGADAVLLIVAALSPPQLGELLAAAGEVGLEALVEVHNEVELAVAMKFDIPLIGVNNRDLRRFTVDLSVAERLIPRIPPGVTVVAESGIHSPADARRMQEVGAQALLIGTHFMRQPSPGKALAALLGEIHRLSE